MRAEDLGLPAGRYERGPLNAITDVPGVAVGHATVNKKASVHSGVTAIVPTVLGPRRRWVPAAVCVGNGQGKLIGAAQVAESGRLETPVLLTATLSAFAAADSMVTWILDQEGNENVTALNPVVGETNDGYLSDVRSRPVQAEHVFAALESATTDAPAEGCVGAGAGTMTLGYKGGIGTASRTASVVRAEGSEERAVSIGALAQTNFSGTLTIQGVQLPADELLPPAEAAANQAASVPVVEEEEKAANSCMIVVATDAPLSPHQLAKIARRAVFAMARVGADFRGASGDYAIAFTTCDDSVPRLPDLALNPVFTATMDAVEEALVHSVTQARSTTGQRGRVAKAVPMPELRRRLEAAGVLEASEG